jgi:VanZ family protein
VNQTLRYRNWVLLVSVFQSRYPLYPAYINAIATMRPITKIRILGVRLGVVVLALYWLALFTGTHIPNVPQILSGYSDKYKHFVAFLGLGLLLCYVSDGENFWRRFGCVLAIGATYGAIDELTQSFVPGRETDILDWGADTLGTATGICFYIGLRFLVKKYRNSIRLAI